ncbi:MAG: stage III sporulation protein AB [Clostridia bacterium]|nr:stage III sporulation protein AB [Clostridia bacterium]
MPGEAVFSQVDWTRAREVRLRAGSPVFVLCESGPKQGARPLTAREVSQAAQALSGYGLAARQKELRRGFLALPGGHRLGVCGVMGEGGLIEITSLCLRLAHAMPGVGETVFSRVRGKSALILGPPGSGKTTLLRDLIRLYSMAGHPVSVADERGEIAACREGKAQLDVGPLTDVISGMEKGKALPLLIRAMAPRVAAADEIGGEDDARAVLEARRCGVLMLATAHGSSVEEVKKRAGMQPLLGPDGFDCAVTLAALGAPPRVTPLGEERG